MTVKSRSALFKAVFHMVMVTALAACNCQLPRPSVVLKSATGLKKAYSFLPLLRSPVPADAGGGQELPAVTETPAPQPVAPAADQAQAAAQDVEPTEGNPPATYTLQKGEFPFCIARRFDLNQAELLALNGLNLDSKPGVGTVLKLPKTGNGFVSTGPQSHPTDYTVKSGDTTAVACQSRMSADMIILQNNLQSPYNLSSGQKLRIP
jgi:LysM repeat protein